MPLPAPPVPLLEACSTIYNNTLYTYSPTAFQSLPLTPGAQWSKLAMGDSVTGAACVLATPTDGKSPVAFYVVGGTTNSSDSSYDGLQRYIFADQRWERVFPTAPVTQNRTNHNAVYLNASSTILVYAGSQDSVMRASSQTFTISTAGPPYTVLAYQSIAPPGISPLLMPWSDTTAVMIGGSDTNKKVMTFSPTSAWVDTGITLTDPLKDIQAVKAVVLDGDDQSKNLFTFDMTVSPNAVNRTILIDGNGNPITNATPVRSRSLAGREDLVELEQPSSSLTKRENLTVSNWPAYNSTLAPTVTRTGFTVAQDSSGLVVISGGSTDDVLCIFKCRDNSWTNATALLSQSSAQAGSSITTTSPSSQTTTQSAGTNTTPSPSSSSTPNSSPNSTMLGAIVGSVVGVAVILIVIFMLFRWRQNRRRHAEVGHQRRSSGISHSEKDAMDAMDFADRGISLGDRSHRYPGHGQQESQSSLSSMAMLMGKVNHSPKRSTVGRRNGSNSSDTSSAFNKKYKTAISNPIPQSMTTSNPAGRVEKGTSFTREPTAPAPRPRRASGAGRRGSTRRSSGWNRYWSGGSALNILGFGSKREEFDRTSGSFYSEAGLPTSSTPVNQAPTPLNLSRPAGRMSRVVSNSPTIGHASSFPLREGMAGRIERSDSTGSVSTYNDRRDTVSTGVPSSIHQESWTPVIGAGWGQGGNPTYSENSFTTILPRARDPDYSARPGPQHSSDMSWLNLGAGEQRR